MVGERESYSGPPCMLPFPARYTVSIAFSLMGTENGDTYRRGRRKSRFGDRSLYVRRSFHGLVGLPFDISA